MLGKKKMKINLNNKTLIKEIIMIMIKDINIKKKNSNFNQNNKNIIKEMKIKNKNNKIYFINQETRILVRITQ